MIDREPQRMIDCATPRARRLGDTEGFEEHREDPRSAYSNTYQLGHDPHGPGLERFYLVLSSSSGQNEEHEHDNQRQNDDILFSV